jgi:hypothetical protein
MNERMNACASTTGVLLRRAPGLPGGDVPLVVVPSHPGQVLHSLPQACVRHPIWVLAFQVAHSSHSPQSGRSHLRRFCLCLHCGESGLGSCAESASHFAGHPCHEGQLPARALLLPGPPEDVVPFPQGLASSPPRQHSRRLPMW